MIIHNDAYLVEVVSPQCKAKFHRYYGNRRINSWYGNSAWSGIVTRKDENGNETTERIGFQTKKSVLQWFRLQQCFYLDHDKLK